jgi:hypothetical protein
MKKDIKFLGYENDNGIDYYEAELEDGELIFIKAEQGQQRFVGIDMVTDECFLLAPELVASIQVEKKKWDIQKIFRTVPPQLRPRRDKNIVFWFNIAHKRANKEKCVCQI